VGFWLFARGQSATFSSRDRGRRLHLCSCSQRLSGRADSSSGAQKILLKHLRINILVRASSLISRATGRLADSLVLAHCRPAGGFIPLLPEISSGARKAGGIAIGHAVIPSPRPTRGRNGERARRVGAKTKCMRGSRLLRSHHTGLASGTKSGLSKRPPLTLGRARGPGLCPLPEVPVIIGAGNRPEPQPLAAPDGLRQQAEPGSRPLGEAHPSPRDDLCLGAKSSSIQR
jgi:hypothetical protein